MVHPMLLRLQTQETRWEEQDLECTCLARSSLAAPGGCAWLSSATPLMCPHLFSRIHPRSQEQSGSYSVDLRSQHPSRGHQTNDVLVHIVPCHTSLFLLLDVSHLDPFSLSFLEK